MTEEHDHNHEHPPTHLGPNVDHSLPERTVLTPMGISQFRDAHLEAKGYRYSFSKPCGERMVEIVYLKDDDTTGTIIADLESLFDLKFVVDDYNKAVCRVTFKILKDVTNPVTLSRADVPFSGAFTSGAVTKMLKGLLDHFLGQVYGRTETAAV